MIAVTTATETVVVVRCDTCTYRLAYPDFFLEAKKPSVRKLFKWLYQYDWQNTRTIEFLEGAFPGFVALVEERGKTRVDKFAERLRECTADYERDYLNPDPATFPKDMTKDEIRSEKQSRKEWNAVRMQRVKNAQANHERAKKEAKSATERAKQVYELFLSEKPNH